MSSLTRLITAASILATLVLLTAASGGSAASLKSCKTTVKEGESLGATYVTKIRVQGASCATAKSVAKAFNACRKEKGLTGRCTRRVKGYSCTETRPASLQIPTQLNGVVKCRSGSKRVNFEYQQNK